MLDDAKKSLALRLAKALLDKQGKLSDVGKREQDKNDTNDFRTDEGCKPKRQLGMPAVGLAHLAPPSVRRLEKAMGRPKPPAFPLYAKEYLTDLAVRSLTFAERGVFIEILCWLWESRIRGVLVFDNSTPITLEYLQKIIAPGFTEAPEVGRSTPQSRGREAAQTLQKLFDRGLLKTSERGYIYSKRMAFHLTQHEQNTLKANKLDVINQWLTIFDRLEIPCEFLEDSLTHSLPFPDPLSPSHSLSPSNPNKTKTFLSETSFSDEVTALTNLLISKMLTNDPKAKCPPLSENGTKDAKWIKWAKEADLLLRVDGREFKEAEQLLHWCQDNSFWKTNILSMSKFRLQYPQLRLKFKADQEWQPEEKETDEQRRKRLIGG